VAGGATSRRPRGGAGGVFEHQIHPMIQAANSPWWRKSSVGAPLDGQALAILGVTEPCEGAAEADEDLRGATAGPAYNAATCP